MLYTNGKHAMSQILKQKGTERKQPMGWEGNSGVGGLEKGKSELFIPIGRGAAF